MPHKIPFLRKPHIRRTVRVRMAMGLFLLAGVLVFSWGAGRAPRCDLPRFGVEAYAGLPVAERGPFAGGAHGHERDLPLAMVMGEMLFMPPEGAGSAPPARVPVCPEYLAQLGDFHYLRTRIFLEDPSTMLLPGDVDAAEFVNADLRIDPSLPGPHVLIFHTHSTEWFVDTGRQGPVDDIMSGIVGVGAYLAQLLAEEYGLEVLHYTGRFDMPYGFPQVRGAYERMEPVITALLAENPQIQFVIDLHRDGVRDGAGPFTREIDGVPTARLMFFNGLSRRNVDGVPTPALWLPNPHQRENLQLSFQAQLAANRLFPGFNRRIYLRAYRFSLHMHPRTLFVEVGNQYNTQREAKNAMHPLAQIIAEVLLAED